MKYLYIEKRQRAKTVGELSKRATRIVEEFEKAGYEYKIAYFDQISIVFDTPALSISADGTDLRDFTHIIFGGHNNGDPDEYRLKVIIAEYIKKYNENDREHIHLQNRDFILGFPNYTKAAMAAHCVNYFLPHLPTYYRKDGKYIGHEKLVGGYPLICKSNTGENELIMADEKATFKKNVYLIENEEGWQQERLSEQDLSQYLIQKYTPVAEDYRIFVAKGKVVGGWKRKSTDGGFMTVSGEREYTLYNDPNQELVQICEQASKAWKVDFMALDFIYSEGKPYILEFSMHPGFNAYENKCLPGDDESSKKPVNIASVIINTL